MLSGVNGARTAFALRRAAQVAKREREFALGREIALAEDLKQRTVFSKRASVSTEGRLIKTCFNL